MPDLTSSGYSGDVSVQSAWDDLKASPDALLIDVRNRAEWTFVGIPVLSDIAKEPLLVEWDDFATGTLVADFEGRLSAELGRVGAGKEAPLYFLCRSGNRSRKAAIAATAIGYAHCFNVEHGFEGKLGPDGHRGTAGSWKGEGLPWTQT